MNQAITEKKILSVLHYNAIKNEQINKICSPLENFSINTFAFSKLFNNGDYILFSNKNEFTRVVTQNDYFYNTQYLREHPQHLSRYKTNKFIWPDKIEDEAIRLLYNYNIRNVCTLAKENQGTLEYYLFGADAEHPLLKDFYENCSSILEDFIVYFNKIAKDLINPSDATKLGCSPYLKKAYSQIESIFEASTPWENKISHFSSLLNTNLQEEIYDVARRSSLSPRELQCLVQLSMGKTVKEIARELNIGPRTVETHMDKIRFKTTCNTQKEIIQWFEDKFKYLFEG